MWFLLKNLRCHPYGELGTSLSLSFYLDFDNPHKICSFHLSFLPTRRVMTTGLLNTLPYLERLFLQCLVHFSSFVIGHPSWRLFLWTIITCVYSMFDYGCGTEIMVATGEYRCVPLKKRNLTISSLPGLRGASPKKIFDRPPLNKARIVLLLIYVSHNTTWYIVSKFQVIRTNIKDFWKMVEKSKKCISFFICTPIAFLFFPRDVTTFLTNCIVSFSIFVLV